MYIVFIIGTAGSGKSLLTASFSEWLQMAKQDVITVNLDPGVLTMPYTPNIDIRDYIKIEDIMKQYGLGPNGALIMAADLIAEETDRLGEEIASFKPDFVLIDTPGQAVYNRFFIPQVHILSKCDLLPPEVSNQVVDWSASPKALETAIEERLKGTKRLLSRDMMRVIYRLGLRFLLIPVSSKTNEGLINLNTALERMFTSGEKYTT